MKWGRTIDGTREQKIGFRLDWNVGTFMEIEFGFQKKTISFFHSLSSTTTFTGNLKNSQVKVD